MVCDLSDPIHIKSREENHASCNRIQHPYVHVQNRISMVLFHEMFPSLILKVLRRCDSLVILMACQRFYHQRDTWLYFLEVRKKISNILYNKNDRIGEPWVFFCPCRILNCNFCKLKSLPFLTRLFLKYLFI